MDAMITIAIIIIYSNNIIIFIESLHILCDNLNIPIFLRLAYIPIFPIACALICTKNW